MNLKLDTRFEDDIVELTAAFSLMNKMTKYHFKGLIIYTLIHQIARCGEKF